MEVVSSVIDVIRDVLVLGDRADKFTAETELLGSIPEFDSMAVVRDPDRPRRRIRLCVRR